MRFFIELLLTGMRHSTLDDAVIFILPVFVIVIYSFVGVHDILWMISSLLHVAESIRLLILSS